MRNRSYLMVVAAAALAAGYIVGRTSSRDERRGEKPLFPLRPGVPAEDPQSSLGCDEIHDIDPDRSVSVLITGAGSYIGEAFRAYAREHYGARFRIDTLDMQDPAWRDHPFTDREGRPYDSVFHVAGIAHADVGHVSAEGQEQYYRVNTDLAIECCRRSKEAGVGQFVFMSSMIVYGGAEYIDRYTKPSPVNFYGDSKWQADKGVRALADESFHVAVLRPPMIYGKGSKGNYPRLAKLARRVPAFPDVQNERSMLYIENLCEFLVQLMLSGSGGIFFPQNAEYVCTSELVKLIGEAAGNRVRITKTLTPGIKGVEYVPSGKVREMVKKVFGSSRYSQMLSSCEGLDYQKVNLEESIWRTELRGKGSVHRKASITEECSKRTTYEKYSVLMSVYHKDSPEELQESIDSMLNQTVPFDQFVLVEDGPIGDALSNVVDRYFNEHEKSFTIVRLKENRGLGRALDEGLKHCRNELVARMDADDISLPTRCERLLQLFQKYPYLSIAGTNIDEFYDDPTNIVSSRVVPCDDKSIKRFMRRRSPFNHPTVMFRKSEVLRCGGYGKMRRKQDLDLFARMLNNGCYAMNINESLLLFRSDEGNYKRRRSWEYCKSYIEVELANYRRGYCSLLDVAVVTVGQLVMHVAPLSVMKLLSDNLLRKMK